MPTPTAALRFIGDNLSRRIHEVSYDPKSATSWREGDLSGKLREVQKKMRTAMRASRDLKFIFNCSRRLGKSYLMLIDALEVGLTERNVPIKFAAPTREQMKAILLPIFKEITMDCPSGLRPIWRSSDHRYIFPGTASELVMEGCSNGHEENLRGTGCRKGYIDEAQAFKNNLKYVVQDIFMPQLITYPNASLLIAGTPPRTPVHDFASMIADAKMGGNYAEYDIYAAGYPSDLIEQFKKEAGGGNSTTFRREYLCQVIMDEESAIIPEWKPEYERVPHRDEYFQFYRKYDAMDIGGRRDRTAILFGWYDFQRATLFVDAELGLPPARTTTQVIADGVKSVEARIFSRKDVDSVDTYPIQLRVADNDNDILLQDLGQMHRIHFVPTNKDELQAMVNQVRLWVSAGRVVVNPECKELIGCLRYAIWNERRDEFERFSEGSDAHKSYGHFDMLAALIYMVRNVNIHDNPVPPDFKFNSRDMFAHPFEQKKEVQALTKLFKTRRHR